MVLPRDDFTKGCFCTQVLAHREREIYIWNYHFSLPRNVGSRSSGCARRMGALLWADFVREIRLLFGASASGDCQGFSALFLVFVALVSSLGGLVFGILIAALIFSPGCRLLVGFALQTAASFLLPNRPQTLRPNLDLRGRLAQYRDHLS